jgi:hypothetical protein
MSCYNEDGTTPSSSASCIHSSRTAHNDRLIREEMPLATPPGRAPRRLGRAPRRALPNAAERRTQLASCCGTPQCNGTHPTLWVTDARISNNPALVTWAHTATLKDSAGGSHEYPCSMFNDFSRRASGTELSGSC